MEVTETILQGHDVIAQLIHPEQVGTKHNHLSPDCSGSSGLIDKYS